MTWVVSVHYTGGSSGEALDVQWAMTVPNEQGAKDIAERLNDIWASQQEDYCAQWFEADRATDLDLPLATAQMIAEELDEAPGPGFVALDMKALAYMLTQGEEPARLPDPPTREEEDEALNSIRRAMGNDAQA